MQDARCLERRQRLGSPAICLEELPTRNSCHSLIPQTPAGILHYFFLFFFTWLQPLVGSICRWGRSFFNPAAPPPARHVTQQHSSTQTTSSRRRLSLHFLSTCVLSSYSVWGVCACQHSGYISYPSDLQWLPLNTGPRISQTREATRRDAV